MSLVQPAQQMYLRGSSIEIERLSPLRSCPSSAQDGQRVTLLCPTARSWVLNVVEDAEFWPSRVRSPHHRFSLRLWRQKLRWDGLPGNQSRKLVTGHLGKRIQVAHLLLKVFIGTVKPEALSCAPVNAQRSTDGIAVPAGLQRIVLGEDFNPFLPAPLDRDTQPQGKAANVDAAIPRWERLRQEYPEMSAPTAVLKSRLHPVLPEVEAKLQEVRERILDSPRRWPPTSSTGWRG